MINWEQLACLVSRMACYKMWRFIWVPNVCQYFCFQKTETSFGNLVSVISVCTTLNANSGDPDDVLQNVAFHLDPHCFEGICI